MHGSPLNPSCSSNYTGVREGQALWDMKTLPSVRGQALFLIIYGTVVGELTVQVDNVWGVNRDYIWTEFHDKFTSSYVMFNEVTKQKMLQGTGQDVLIVGALNQCARRSITKQERKCVPYSPSFYLRYQKVMTCVIFVLPRSKIP